MEPSLVEGQGLITTPYGRAKPGQVRCVVTAAGATFADVMAEGSYRVLIAIPKRFM